MKINLGLTHIVQRFGLTVVVMSSAYMGGLLGARIMPDLVGGVFFAAVLSIGVIAMQTEITPVGKDGKHE